MELSENEANSLLNYQELKQAIEDGYTHKTWVTERDNRVRDDHRDKEGETIPIAEYFEFPDCEMLCPHDVVNGTARQNANCRCSLRYSYEENGFGESAKRNKGVSKYNVDWHIVRSKEYTERFSTLSDNDKANALIASKSRKALTNRDGKNTEELYAVGLKNGTLVSKITDQNYPFAIKRTPKFNSDIERAEKNGENVLFIHNHPGGTPPSLEDLNELLNHERAVGITVGHNGSIYYYTRPKRLITEDDYTIAKMDIQGYNVPIVKDEKILEALSEEFGFTFKIL